MLMKCLCLIPLLCSGASAQGLIRFRAVAEKPAPTTSSVLADAPFTAEATFEDPVPSFGVKILINKMEKRGETRYREVFIPVRAGARYVHSDSLYIEDPARYRLYIVNASFKPALRPPYPLARGSLLVKPAPPAKAP